MAGKWVQRAEYQMAQKSVQCINMYMYGTCTCTVHVHVHVDIQSVYLGLNACTCMYVYMYVLLTSVMVVRGVFSFSSKLTQS